MADIKTKYGTEAQAITITLDSLTNNSSRQSTVIDNTTDLYTDALVQVSINVPAGTALATAVCEVYAYGMVDYTTTPTYPDWTSGIGSDPIDGTDGAVVLPSTTNLTFLGTVACPTNASNAYTYVSRLMAVAPAFGGILPAKWGIVVTNKTGLTLASGCFAHYQGVLLQAV
ncbi:MAG: hypothetical protein FD177_983 [Desulfovibrionaceae bacterium]|nr:MAG: hypothetical protein FD177_983 [Desulfovibrionaceae bacterium]